MLFEAIVIFMGGFAWLLWNMAPSLTVGDAGEFIAASSILGVAHSPGYPLALLLGKLALIILPGPPAYKANLVSALSVSGGWTILWVIWRRHFNLSRWMALPFILLAALEPHFLTVGTETEVFALLVFGALLIFWLILEEKYLAAAFFFGLMLGNHHTLVLLAPAFFLPVVLKLKCAGLSRVLILGIREFLVLWPAF
ncbi:MAG: DUF2723 domain-containing protein [Elusimicrobia bacterium]|nr:DUF2723 domain-containing protein [Elusimicrobiota bacterium]